MGFFIGTQYEVTTYTSDKSGASTDADVYIVLYGVEISTAQKSLCTTKAERKSSFKKGAMDKFVIEVGFDVIACSIQSTLACFYTASLYTFYGNK